MAGGAAWLTWGPDLRSRKRTPRFGAGIGELVVSDEEHEANRAAVEAAIAALAVDECPQRDALAAFDLPGKDAAACFNRAFELVDSTASSLAADTPADADAAMSSRLGAGCAFALTGVDELDVDALDGGCAFGLRTAPSELVIRAIGFIGVERSRARLRVGDVAGALDVLARHARVAQLLERAAGATSALSPALFDAFEAVAWHDAATLADVERTRAAVDALLASGTPPAERYRALLVRFAQTELRTRGRVGVAGLRDLLAGVDNQCPVDARTYGRCASGIRAADGYHRKRRVTANRTKDPQFHRATAALMGAFEVAGDWKVAARQPFFLLGLRMSFALRAHTHGRSGCGSADLLLAAVPEDNPLGKGVTVRRDERGWTVRPPGWMKSIGGGSYPVTWHIACSDDP